MRALTLLLFFLIALSPAHAWNAAGHQMTAEIAFGLLDATEQQQIAAVLRAHPRFAEDFAAAMPDGLARKSATGQALWIFRHASIWPDLIPRISESLRNRYHRGSWHYINLPVFLTQDDGKSFDGKLPHNMSMEFEPPLRQNLNVIQALDGNLRVWRDDSMSDSDRAVALCWILHLAGDMHQPLHTVALFSRAHFPGGDRGGNDIRIEQHSEVTNLHAVWDGMPGDFGDLMPSAATSEMLKIDIVDISAPVAWLHRHYELARTFVYTPSLKTDLRTRLAKDASAAMILSEDYRSNAAAVAKEQVIIAGHRIAALLTRQAPQM